MRNYTTTEINETDDIWGHTTIEWEGSTVGYFMTFAGQLRLYLDTGVNEDRKNFGTHKDMHKWLEKVFV